LKGDDFMSLTNYTREKTRSDLHRVAKRREFLWAGEGRLAYTKV